MIYEINKDIEELCYYLEYYDKHKKFPWEKVRIDVTISEAALDKLKGRNKSKIINELIIKN